MLNENGHGRTLVDTTISSKPEFNPWILHCRNVSLNNPLSNSHSLNLMKPRNVSGENLSSDFEEPSCARTLNEEVGIYNQYFVYLFCIFNIFFSLRVVHRYY